MKIPKGIMIESLYLDDSEDDILIDKDEEVLILGQIPSDKFGNGLGYVIYLPRTEESYSIESGYLRISERGYCPILNKL